MPTEMSAKLREAKNDERINTVNVPIPERVPVGNQLAFPVNF